MNAFEKPCYRWNFDSSLVPGQTTRSDPDQQLSDTGWTIAAQAFLGAYDRQCPKFQQLRHAEIGEEPTATVTLGLFRFEGSQFQHRFLRLK